MKKIVLALCAIILVSVSTIALSGCSGSSQTFEQRVRSDWRRDSGSLPPDTFINYGEHGDFIAFFVSNGNNIPTNFVTADTVFRYQRDMTIWLWRDGNWRRMITAFNSGTISSDVVASIGYVHSNRMREVWSGPDYAFDAWYFNTSDIPVTPIIPPQPGPGGEPPPSCCD